MKTMLDIHIRISQMDGKIGIDKEKIKETILKFLSDHHISTTERTRSRDVVVLKQALVYKVCKLRKKHKYSTPIISLKTIGKIIGGYDHSTIIHSNRKFSDLLEIEDEYAIQALKAVNEYF